MAMPKSASQPRRVRSHTGWKSCSLRPRSSGRPTRTGGPSSSSGSARCRASTLMGVPRSAGPRSCELGVRVADADEVRGARARAVLVQEVVPALVAVELRDGRLRVVEVPEDDGLRRAGLRAGGGELALADGPPLDARLDARALDALHAVGAL